jgi:predicted ATPase
MRVTRIVAENVLSFGHVGAELDDGLTVFVGPNGAGKTNLVRALTMGGLALDSIEGRSRQPPGDTGSQARIALESFAASRHRSAPPGLPMRVVIGLVLGDQDLEELTCFMRAAILSTVMSGRQGQHGPEVAEWAEAHVTPQSLADLARGELVLRHEGSSDAPWQVSWEFQSSGSRCRWGLSDVSGGQLRIMSDGCKAQRPGSASYVQLWKALSAADREFSPLPSFDLSLLFRHDGQPVEAPLVHTGGGMRLEPELAPHRKFASMADVQLWTQLASRTYSLAWLLRRVLQRGLIIAGEQLRGVGATAAPLRPLGLYGIEELALGTEGFDPSALPLRLLRLKNSSSIEDRGHFRRVQELFGELAPGRQVELSLQVRLTPRFDTDGRAIGQDTDASVTILVAHTDEDSGEAWELPIEMCGAGTWEALVLAEALAGSDERVIIFDEPALNLHPGWQQLLLTHLRSRSGQSMLITHSPYLLPLQDEDDIYRIVRVSRQNGATKLSHVHRPMSDPLGVLRDFSMSADARAMLFASGVVLVEGETELGALPLWFAKSAAAARVGDPRSRHLAIYSVGSDTHFRTPLTLLAALGIPWVIVCDGGPFGPRAGGNHIFRQVAAAGTASPELTDWIKFFLEDPTQSDKLTFATVTEEARRHGIFTLAPAWDRTSNNVGVSSESFEAFIENSAGLAGQLEAARAEVGKSKVRQGRWLAESHPCPPAVSRLYEDIIDTLWPNPRHDDDGKVP